MGINVEVQYGNVAYVLVYVYPHIQTYSYALFITNLSLTPSPLPTLSICIFRSRHYAGTRYLKRGLNVCGKVANDCEVEQVLQYVDEGGQSRYAVVWMCMGAYLCMGVSVCGNE